MNSNRRGWWRWIVRYRPPVLVAGDASPEALIPPERAGWEVRYVGSEPRLSEVAELYRELGFEVRIEPYIPPVDCGECKTCLESAGEGMKVVYVKEGIK